jgi:lipoyl(octanoyl) transferase
VARFIHLTGPCPYAEVHALQEALVADVGAGRCPDTVLLLEHAPTITLGRKRGAEGNVLAPDGVPVVSVERGGDVTWHAPGQLVAYPIVALPPARQDLRGVLASLESAVSALLQAQGLAPQRDPRNTGVWLPCADGEVRKVCSVGVAVRGWVTWHGLALNVDNSLDAFARIRPCGFGAEVMTRLADHLAPCPPVDALVAPLAAALAAALVLEGPVEVTAATLAEVRASCGGGAARA